ncbi:MAG: hypothetical protein ACI89T_000714 [Cognaticolwellia sp.]|jgi:hypothetical protein
MGWLYCKQLNLTLPLKKQSFKVSILGQEKTIMMGKLKDDVAHHYLLSKGFIY